MNSALYEGTVRHHRRAPGRHAFEYRLFMVYLDLSELEENYWYQGPDEVPTCRSVVAHMRLVLEADLNHPIILCSEGRIMDGMHRVGKALLEGRESIGAVRFATTPDPDKRARAEGYGATVIDPVAADLTAAIHELTDGRRVEILPPVNFS